MVPFKHGRREIDAVYIDAKSAAEAKRLAQPIWVEHGYTKEAGYSIGKPIVCP